MPRSLRRCAVSVRRRAKEAALREECSVMSWKVRKRERRERKSWRSYWEERDFQREGEDGGRRSRLREEGTHEKMIVSARRSAMRHAAVSEWIGAWGAGSVGSGGASGGEEPGSGGGVGGRPLESAGGALSGARGTAEPAGGALSGARGTAEPAGGALRGARGTAEPAGGALSGARGTAEPAGGALSGARGTAEPAGGLSALVVALDLLIRAKGPLGITKGVKRVMLLTGGGTPLEEASEASNEEQVCGKGGQIDAGGFGGGGFPTFSSLCNLAPPSHPNCHPPGGNDGWEDARIWHRSARCAAETTTSPPPNILLLHPHHPLPSSPPHHPLVSCLSQAATVAGKMHEYGIALHAVLLSGRVEGEEAEAGGADDDGDPGGERAEARDVAYENEKLLRRFFDAGACRVHGGRREEQEKLKEADDGGRCGKRCKREENGTGDARAEGGGGADEEEEEEKEEEKGVGSGGVVCGGELRVVASLAAAGMLYRVKPRVLPTTSYRGDLLVAPGCTIKATCCWWRLALPRRPAAGGAWLCRGDLLLVAPGFAIKVTRRPKRSVEPRMLPPGDLLLVAPGFAAATCCWWRLALPRRPAAGGAWLCRGDLLLVAPGFAIKVTRRPKSEASSASLPTTSYQGVIHHQGSGIQEDLSPAPLSRFAPPSDPSATGDVKQDQECRTVWSYKKTFPQRLPPLKLLSRLAPPSDPSATGDVKMEREYRVVESGADGHGEGGGDGGDGGGEGEEGGGAEGGGGAGEELETVGLDELVRAYKYGPQVIPVSEYDRMANRFQAEKGIQIIGFTMRDQIPRHYFIKDTAILLPEPSNTKAALALSALAQAMESSEKVAIVRFKLTNRADSGVALGVLMPWCRGKRGFTEEEDESVPDLLLFNAIPFSEDIREFSFPSLEAAPPNQQPTAVQSSAAAALVQAMSLVRCSEVGEDDEEYNKEEGVGEDEKLRPEDTPSPALQHSTNTISFIPAFQIPQSVSPPRLAVHPSHPPSLPLILPPSHSPSHSPTLPLSLSFSHPPTLPLILPPSLSHSPTLPLSFSHPLLPPNHSTSTIPFMLHYYDFICAVPCSGPPLQGPHIASPCLSSCFALPPSHTTTISSELESCTPRPAYPLYLPLVLFTPAHPSHSQSSPPPSQHYYDFIRARVLRPKAPILFSFPLLLFTAPTLPLSEYHSPTLQSLPPSSLQHYYDFIRARVLRPKAPIPPLPAALAAPLSHPLSADHPATRSFAAAFPALGDHTAPLSQQPLQLSQAEPSPDEPAPAAAAPSRPDSPVARDQSRETSAGPSGVTSAGH
ncbi:unnamed protein product [Closterium sp. NIES-65]|nr:unnamed protein product [Closterium sp. NIES-65]